MTFKEMVEEFQSNFAAAPKYSTWSKNLNKKIKTKGQHQTEFIDNLLMMEIVEDDPVVLEKIKAMLQRFE